MHQISSSDSQTNTWKPSQQPTLFFIANHLKKKCKKNFYRSQEEVLAIRDVKVLFVDCFSSSSLLSALASPSFHLSAFVVCIGKSEMQKNALRSSSGCPIPVEFQFSFFFRFHVIFWKFSLSGNWSWFNEDHIIIERRNYVKNSRSFEKICMSGDLKDSIKTSRKKN